MLFANEAIVTPRKACCMCESKREVASMRRVSLGNMVIWSLGVDGIGTLITGCCRTSIRISLPASITLSVISEDTFSGSHGFQYAKVLDKAAKHTCTYFEVQGQNHVTQRDSRTQPRRRNQSPFICAAYACHRGCDRTCTALRHTLDSAVCVCLCCRLADDIGSVRLL